MPRGAGQRPQTYRIALTIAIVVAMIAAIFGAMPIAVLVAAFAVPVVYIVYIYDVNLWEDEPVIVTGSRFLLTGALTVGFHDLVDLSPRTGAVRHHDVRRLAECANRRHFPAWWRWSVPIVGEAMADRSRSCWPVAPSSTT